MPSLKKKVLEFYFSNSLDQIITSPARTTDRKATRLDNVLKNLCHKVSQSGVIDLGLSGHDPKFSPKSHKHNES